MTRGGEPRGATTANEMPSCARVAAVSLSSFELAPAAPAEELVFAAAAAAAV